MNYQGIINTIVIKRDNRDQYSARSPLTDLVGKGGSIDLAKRDFVNRLNARVVERLNAAPKDRGRPGRPGLESLHCKIRPEVAGIIKTEARSRGISVGDFVDYVVMYHAAAESTAAMDEIAVDVRAGAKMNVTVPSKRGRPRKPDLTLEDFRDSEGYFVFKNGKTDNETKTRWKKLKELLVVELEKIKPKEGSHDIEGMALQAAHWLSSHPGSAKSLEDFLVKALQ